MGEDGTIDVIDGKFLDNLLGEYGGQRATLLEDLRRYYGYDNKQGKFTNAGNSKEGPSAKGTSPTVH